MNTETTERRALVRRVLDQWYTREAEKLEGTWYTATQHSALPRLRMAVDEVCANWTQAKRPQPGDLNAIAHRDSQTITTGADEITLDQLRDQARDAMRARGLQPDDRTIMRTMRSLLASSRTPRLTVAALEQAVAEGIISHMPGSTREDRAMVPQLIALAAAGYGWCDSKRAFIPSREVVDLDHEAEENGTPYPPRSMTAGAVGGAFAALQNGTLPRIPRPPSKWSRNKRDGLTPLDPDDFHSNRADSA